MFQPSATSGFSSSYFARPGGVRRLQCKVTTTSGAGKWTSWRSLNVEPIGTSIRPRAYGRVRGSFCESREALDLNAIHDCPGGPIDRRCAPFHDFSLANAGDRGGRLRIARVDRTRSAMVRDEVPSRSSNDRISRCRSRMPATVKPPGSSRIKSPRSRRRSIHSGFNRRSIPTPRPPWKNCRSR